MDNNNQNKNEQEWDATLEEETPEVSEQKLQDSILEDSDLNGFQKWAARVDDKKWKLYQIILGIVLGLGAGVALFWDTLTGKVATEGQKSAFSMPLIIALVIAMVVPNIIEKQAKRKIQTARIAMIIALGAVLVIYFAVTATRGGLAA